ncbi:MAG TPA: ATP-dependent helicase [Candidatus Blautia merdipullorum]|nr:ATP-dependent helicase [Candidatus Blautia merdipullorum]
METKENKDWEKLNEYQKEAVLDDSPACVVNANVGSGKTTVLIAKVLYLYLEKKVPLEDMLVLTFTNKAAQEILSRLLLRGPELSPEQRAGFGTFHSVALRLLKEKLPVEKAGWDRDFSVMEPEEETELAQRIIKEEKLNIKYKNRLKKRLEQEYKAYLEGREVSRYGDDLFRLYPLLKQEKQRENKMSFSDLLLVSTELIKEEGFHPAWVIADEIQDSDNLQLGFLEALVGEETRVFAVGDPNQVIYSWRGSSDSTFFALKRRFSAKELSLPVNYRSNARILEAANHFRQFGTRIQGCREGGKLIKVKRQYDPFTEAEYLAEQIESLHKAGESYEDTAILYRLQRQGEVLEKVFEKRGIPYQVSVKQTVKDIPALDWVVKILRFSVNPRDRQTGEDVLLNPGFGEKLTKKKVRDLLEEGKGKSFLYEQMKGFQDWSLGHTKIPKWREIFDYFGLGEAFGPTSAGYKEREEQAGKLLEWLRVYCEKKELSLWEGTRAFLNDGALYGMNLGEIMGEREESLKGVRLMTLHASKGLEFHRVYLIGVNQGLIPLRCKTMEQEEEERRLFFVGMTRAKEELELSYYVNPREPGVSGEGSRYLLGIPPELLDWEEDVRKGRGEETLRKLGREVREELRKKKEAENMAPVLRVRHRKYGEGILLSQNELTMEVEFPGYGRKQFLKALGEIEVLSQETGETYGK